LFFKITNIPLFEIDFEDPLERLKQIEFSMEKEMNDIILDERKSEEE